MSAEDVIINASPTTYRPASPPGAHRTAATANVLASIKPGARPAEIRDIAGDMLAVADRREAHERGAAARVGRG